MCVSPWKPVRTASGSLVLLGERWSVNQMCMQFSRRHDGYLTRTWLHRLHVDANVDAVSLHDPDTVVFALPRLLLLLRPNPRLEAKPLFSRRRRSWLPEQSHHLMTIAK